MDKLIGAAASIGDTKIRNDDDFIDRLNHRYTTFILITFAIVVSTKQYVGEPINCWCPAQFTDNHEDFTNKICWVSNTYYLPIIQKRIPEEHDARQIISYYQWVPMILLCQALLFYLPVMVWRVLNNKSGVDVNNIVEAGVTLQHTAYADLREKTVRFMTMNMDRYLSSTREYRTGCLTNCKHFVSRHLCLLCGKRYGNYIVCLYSVTKFLYLVNCLGQLFLLNAFLGTEYHAYGIQVLVNLIHSKDWTASEKFPRVTLCDFHVRQLGNIHRHTVQCVLPINLFNEKIYIFIWFWFVFISLITFVSLVTWLAKMLFKLDQVRYVKQHLKCMGALPIRVPPEEKKLVGLFVTRYLKQDGILVLRLIGLNANELVVAELLKSLWEIYKSRAPQVMRNRRDINAV